MQSIAPNHNNQKKIALINDITGFGRCSVAVQLPIISQLGVQCCVLPTSILSNHTGFPSYSFQDFTPHMHEHIDEWRKLNLQFRGICTGFLGSAEQISIVRDFIDEFGGDDCVTLVDPVMGDEGKAYGTYTPEMCGRMAELVAHADIITPNITEACLLTGTLYREQHDEDYVRALLEKLLAFGPRTVILTGVRPADGRMGVAAMDASGEMSVHLTEYIPAVFHGTGDLFASACVGYLTLGRSTAEAIRRASEYVVRTLRVTAQNPDARWYGVDFETTLPLLWEKEEA